MKKLLFVLLTLSATATFAQYGNNAYYGGNMDPNAYTGVNHTYTTPGNGYGTNAYYNGGNNGGTRVRWETSPCGTFRWQIQETSCWVPGAWAYTNGCRNWVPGYYAWTPVCRTRVYHNHSCFNGCGHAVGYYYYQNGGWCNTPRSYAPRGVYANGGTYTHHHGGHVHGHGPGRGPRR